MSEILKLTQFVKNDSVSEMDVGSGRIETEFDTKRLAVASARASFCSSSCFNQKCVGAAFD